MPILSTVRRYFEALSTQNGALAGSLFTKTGVIDDFRGRHHAGQQAIAQFINNVPPLKLEFLTDFIVEPSRVTVYARINYTETSNVLVRWIFVVADDQIAHLCNSRIEHIPVEQLKAAT